MKMIRIPALSAEDEAELEMFIQFLRVRNEGKTDREAYADTYGEVLYEVEES